MAEKRIDPKAPSGASEAAGARTAGAAKADKTVARHTKLAAKHTKSVAKKTSPR